MVEVALMVAVQFERRRWSFSFYSNDNRKWRVVCECGMGTDPETGQINWPAFPVSVIETGKENDVLYTATYMNMEQKAYDNILALITAHGSVYLQDETELLEDFGVN
jgi:hypothetical protein